MVYREWTQTIVNEIRKSIPQIELVTAGVGHVFNGFKRPIFFADNEAFEKVMTYYIHTVIPHKKAVYEQGEELLRILYKEGIHFDFDEQLYQENLLMHDKSKFSIEEVDYAFTDWKDPESRNRPAMKKAWHHHKQYNPHHPEHWWDVDRSGVVSLLEMPDIYIVEMIADWLGASEVYGTPFREWAKKNIHTFEFHPVSAARVAQITNILCARCKWEVEVMKSPEAAPYQASSLIISY